MSFYFVIAASAGEVQQDRFCVLQNHLLYLAEEPDFVWLRACKIICHTWLKSQISFG